MRKQKQLFPFISRLQVLSSHGGKLLCMQPAHHSSEPSYMKADKLQERKELNRTEYSLYCEGLVDGPLVFSVLASQREEVVTETHL